MKATSIILLAGIGLGTACLSGCGLLISGTMNASLDDNAVFEKTAKHFGVPRNEIVISGIEKKTLATTYQVKHAGILYNCSIYYGEVSCMQPGGSTVLGDMVPQGRTPATLGKSASEAPVTLSEQKMTLAQAQTRLNQLGYPVGTPDGVLGKNSVRQLKLFQQAKGLPATGKLDEATVATLR